MNDHYLLNFLLITVFVSTQVLGYQNYHSKSLPGTCDEIGTFCSGDCQTIFSCTQVEQPPKTQTCKDISEHEFCKETSNNTATCSSNSNDCKGEASTKIICGQFGEFPHPLDCTKTVQCRATGEEPFAICRCSDPTYGIDITSAGLPCDPNQRQDCTKSYKQLCPNPAHTGGIDDSTAYCFTCTDESVVVHNCKTAATALHSEITQRAVSKDCLPTPQFSSPPTISPTDSPSSEPPASESSPPPPTTSEPSASESSPPPTSSEPPASESSPPPTSSEPPAPESSSPPPTHTDLPSTTTSTDYECDRPGSTSPDPSDCHSYFKCNKYHQLVHFKCPPGNYYHKEARICVVGDC